MRVQGKFFLRLKKIFDFLIMPGFYFKVQFQFQEYKKLLDMN